MPLKGHKPVPKSNGTHRVRVQHAATVMGDYMAWDCYLCHKPIHVADSGRWRHGERPGGERHEV